MKTKTPTETIASLNDLIRSTMISSPRWSFVVTAGVQALPDEMREKLLTLMREFNSFTPDNDPHKEHDFGKITLDGIDYFWKFDYYSDMSCEYGAENPAVDCFRVLTLMKAEEY